jgi:hypothetical protein
MGKGQQGKATFFSESGSKEHFAFGGDLLSRVLQSRFVQKPSRFARMICVSISVNEPRAMRKKRT